MQTGTVSDKILIIMKGEPTQILDSEQLELVNRFIDIYNIIKTEIKDSNIRKVIDNFIDLSKPITYMQVSMFLKEFCTIVMN